MRDAHRIGGLAPFMRSPGLYVLPWLPFAAAAYRRESAEPPGSIGRTSVGLIRAETSLRLAGADGHTSGFR